MIPGTWYIICTDDHSHPFFSVFAPSFLFLTSAIIVAPHFFFSRTPLFIYFSHELNAIVVFCLSHAIIVFVSHTPLLFLFLTNAIIVFISHERTPLLFFFFS
ncbi:unnamed protein product, partial [Laminaria digitata]